jgi:hypothetical protein
MRSARGNDKIREEKQQMTYTCSFLKALLALQVTFP